MNPGDVGDLMGAIHGIRLVGFIGDTYKRFPFPAARADFKQNPDGYRNREFFEDPQFPKKVANR